MTPSRKKIALSIVGFILIILIARLIYLHVDPSAFLREQGNKRTDRHVVHQAPRGTIYDRHGQPLGISIPMDTLWVNPQHVNIKSPKWQKLAKLIQLTPGVLLDRINTHKNKHFIIIKKKASPQLVAQAKQLNIKGLAIQTTYERYYPESESMANIIGLVDYQQNGQEGIEKTYDHWLKGQNGHHNVQHNRKGMTIKEPKTNQQMQSGKAIYLTLDKRTQNITYKALKQAVTTHLATAGTAVVMDIKSGDILAMASVPSFNPNNRKNLLAGSLKNRVLTDVFEPGSTLKPLAVALALEKKVISPHDHIQTAPGEIRVGHNWVKDPINHGTLSVEQVIQKSSNVGVSKIILETNPEDFLSFLTSLGFGQISAVPFPGQQSGVLPYKRPLGEFALATLAFGYGISASTLQLAQAYATLGNSGVLVDPRLLLHAQALPNQRVLSQQVASQVLTMLESVVSHGGTGVRAQVPGYKVAGKTGTTRKAAANGYDLNAYTALFVGVIPAQQPKYVMAVMIDDPKGERYYGGSVAAPVFASVMKQIIHHR